jgi:hypothetical protein
MSGGRWCGDLPGHRFHHTALSELQRWDKFATLVADPVVGEVWWSRLLAFREIPDCATLLEVD